MRCFSLTNIALLPVITGAANTSADGDCILQIGFQNSGVPIDLTGIAFSLNWNLVNPDGSVNPNQVLISASTAGNYLTNGTVTGVVSLNVPALKLSRLATGTYQGDLIATAGSETLVVGTIVFTHMATGACLWTALTTTVRNAATANSVGYIPGPGWNQYKANWSSTAAYLTNDVVYDGAISTWIALQPSTNVAPAVGAFWNVVAQGISPTALNAAMSSASASASTATTQAGNAATSASAAAAAAALAGALRGYIGGLTLSNDAANPNTVLDIAPGMATSDDESVLIQLPSAFTKALSAWAVGTGKGGLDTGVVAANTGYHVFLIERIDTGVVDVLFSLSATAPTMPSGYTKKRRIGWIKTNASSQIVAFSQNGDEFIWAAPTLDVNALGVVTTPSLTTMSVPLGIKVNAIIRGLVLIAAGATSGAFLINSPDETSTGADIPSSNITLNVAAGENLAFGQMSVRTNTSGQIRMVSGTTSNIAVTVVTVGWIDTRGRL